MVRTLTFHLVYKLLNHEITPFLINKVSSEELHQLREKIDQLIPLVVEREEVRRQIVAFIDENDYQIHDLYYLTGEKKRQLESNFGPLNSVLNILGKNRSGRKPHNLIQFLRKLESRKPGQYSANERTEYIHAKEKLIITCNRCGDDYHTTPNNVLNEGNHMCGDK
jgi:hypothetical protein